MKINADKILGYTADVVETAAPYAEKIGNYVKSIAVVGCNKIKNTSKKVKKQMKIIKIKQTIELVTNIVLLIAAVIALIMAVFGILYDKDRKDI